LESEGEKRYEDERAAFQSGYNSRQANDLFDFDKAKERLAG
jgi:hypothetical protein